MSQQPILSDAKAIAIIQLPTYKSNVFSDTPIDYNAMAKAHDAVKPVPQLGKANEQELERMVAEAIEYATDEPDLLSLMQSVKNHEVPLTKSHRKNLLCKKSQ